MTIATTPLVPPSSSDPRRSFCLAARQAYEDAVNNLSCDGAVSSASWWAIAGDLHLAALTMRSMGALESFVVCAIDRARDAEMRAQFAERMVQVAAKSRVIDMDMLVGGAS